jgi:DNA-binding response OmpR family regulator
MAAKTILVIEDDDAARAGFGIILTKHGFAVSLAASAKDGLEYLQNHEPPNLIILDMLMRGMDGWQFLKQSDAQWSSVPVLIVTALPIASDEWARSLGACSWLAKPIEATALVARVQKCLGTTG